MKTTRKTKKGPIGGLEGLAAQIKDFVRSRHDGPCVIALVVPPWHAKNEVLDFVKDDLDGLNLRVTSAEEFQQAVPGMTDMVIMDAHDLSLQAQQELLGKKWSGKMPQVVLVTTAHPDELESDDAKLAGVSSSELGVGWKRAFRGAVHRTFTWPPDTDSAKHLFHSVIGQAGLKWAPNAFGPIKSQETVESSEIMRLTGLAVRAAWQEGSKMVTAAHVVAAIATPKHERTSGTKFVVDTTDDDVALSA